MNAHRNVAEALEKISEIHAHVAKGEVYRGYRPLSTALSGVVGFAGAAAQPLAVRSDDLRGFVLYWVALAAFNLALHGAVILRRYLNDDGYARRRTLKVLGQFAPSLAGGALLTAALAVSGSGSMSLLPGAWAMLFSLALFSSRPYLPRRIGWVALFYLAAAGVLLFLEGSDTARLGLAMGATFGAGQVGAAVVLHRDEERHG